MRNNNAAQDSDFDTTKIMETLNSGNLTSMLCSGLSQLLATMMQKEREFHLSDNPDQRANGYAPPRTLHMGTTPIAVEVPRTRGDFYPAILPKYQRNIPHEYERLLRSILLNAKSFSAAERTLQSMGLSVSEQQMKQLIQDLASEAQDFYARPLASDYLFIYMDAKVICLRDEKGVLLQGINFIVIGVNTEARKEILLNKVLHKRESLDAWREVLLDLKNRGMSRVMCFITDDFPGLTKLIKGFFPQADHQLCTVHLLRNAFRHMSKEDYKAFAETFKSICASSSLAAATDSFLALCDQFQDRYKSFFRHVTERSEHYLVFAKYPHMLWGYIRTTNCAESINNQIEIIKRNAGGHFHTVQEITIKTWIMSSALNLSRWKKPIARYKAELQLLLTMRDQRYESEGGAA